MKAFCCRLSPDLYAAASRYAKGEGLSLNSVITLALHQYLDGAQRTPDAVNAPSVAHLQRGMGQKMSSLDRNLTCDRRFRPSGLIGADFLTEYRRYIDYWWYRNCDRRVPQLLRGSA